MYCNSYFCGCRASTVRCSLCDGDLICTVCAKTKVRKSSCVRCEVKNVTCLECLGDPNLWDCDDHKHTICECETAVCFQCEKEKVLKYCKRNCGKPVQCKSCELEHFEIYHKCEENA